MESPLILGSCDGCSWCRWWHAPRLYRRNPSAKIVSAESKCQDPATNWQDFRCRAFCAGTIVWPVFSATRGYIFDHKDGYSSRPPGLAHRFGVSVADNIDGKFMSSYLMQTLSGHRREPYRYIGLTWARCERRQTQPPCRTAPAARRSDTGWSFKNFNWSAMPASAASTAVSDIYRPQEERAFGENVHRFSLSLGIFAAKDFASEFLCGTTKFHLNKLASWSPK